MQIQGKGAGITAVMASMTQAALYAGLIARQGNDCLATPLALSVASVIDGFCKPSNDCKQLCQESEKTPAEIVKASMKGQAFWMVRVFSTDDCSMALFSTTLGIRPTNECVNKMDMLAAYQASDAGVKVCKSTPGCNDCTLLEQGKCIKTSLGHMMATKVDALGVDSMPSTKSKASVMSQTSTGFALAGLMALL
jgi:hypothetical protein